MQVQMPLTLLKDSTDTGQLQISVSGRINV